MKFDGKVQPPIVYIYIFLQSDPSKKKKKRLDVQTTTKRNHPKHIQTYSSK